MQITCVEYIYKGMEVDEGDIEYVFIEIKHLRYLQWSLDMQVQFVECIYIWMEMDGNDIEYGATVSRINEICCPFCRISSLLQGSFAKETCSLIDPTDQSHPICMYGHRASPLFAVESRHAGAMRILCMCMN